MCRWIAYLGNSVPLGSILIDSDNSLVKQSVHCTKGDPAVNGDGFGLGWRSDCEEPAIYTDIMPAWNDPNILSLCKHINSSLFFGHIRASTGGGVSRENCHPFSYQKYMFMHNGMVQNFDKYRRGLESLLTDEFYQLRKGSTDSELIFYILLQNHFFENPQKATQEMIRIIESQMRAVQDTEVKDYLRMTLCLADEESIYLVRYSGNPKPPSAFYKKLNSGWVISSEPTEGELNSWNKIPENSLSIFLKNKPTVECFELSKS